MRCPNWFTHIFKCFVKKPFSRFAVSLERLGEKLGVTERKFVKQLKNLPNVCRTEKSNSKQTNCMIEKFFLAFTIKWFALGICFTPYYTLYFPVELHLVILFSLKLSQIKRQTAEVLGNLTDFLFFYLY